MEHLPFIFSLTLVKPAFMLAFASVVVVPTLIMLYFTAKR
ncbi:hypothetical protein Arno162_21 [Pectobacterium phage Arno162]|uniref:Uncharacterized protein n=1 Tax=Pectobacterium phage Arno162 TaxID=2500577 RepID=A0A678ZJI4_9CAUD|nr:hypothetical protein Arno162_21 [Pectobacterium phage Arno162]